MTTDRIGAIAEAAIALAAIKLGVGVLRPLSDGERYDYSARRAPDGSLRRPYSSDEIDFVISGP